MDVHVSSLLKYVAFLCGVLSLICANFKKSKKASYSEVKKLVNQKTFT